MNILDSKQNLFLLFGIAIFLFLARHFHITNNFVPLIAIIVFLSKINYSKFIVISALIIPLLINDLLNNFHITNLVTYIFIIFNLLVLPSIQNFNLGKNFLLTLYSCIAFYLISNLSVWIFQNLYPKNFSGLLSCYIMALPFFKNTLLSNLIGIILILGIYKKITSIQNSSDKTFI